MKRIRIIAVLAALATGLCIYLFLQKLNEPVEIPKTSIVVAAVNIKENTVITTEMLTYSAIPSEAVLAGSTTDISKVVGKATNSDILAGEQILTGRLVQLETTDSTNTMAYTVAPGMRAATVTINTTSGIAGMLKPGNRIDIIWIHYPESVVIDEETGEPKTDETTGEELITSELEVTVLFENMKILAVDGIMDKTGSAEGYSTLTLEFTPEQVLELYYAMNIGSLTAMLRNSTDMDELEILPVNGDNIKDAISDNKPEAASPSPIPSPSPSPSPEAGEQAETSDEEAQPSEAGEDTDLDGGGSGLTGGENTGLAGGEPQ